MNYHNSTIFIDKIFICINCILQDEGYNNFMGVAQVKAKTKNTKSLVEPPKISIRLEINAQKQVPVQLNQLKNWSLTQIKTIYQTFQRIAESPIMDSFLFKKIMPYSKKNSDIMFAMLSQGRKFISVFELVCLLVITSYQTYRKKFQFIVLIFDLEHKGYIYGKQFLLTFYSMLYGYCRLTQQDLPKFQTVEKFAQASLFPGQDDFQNKPINLRKFIQQYDGNPNISQIFNRFQQSQLKQIKQDPLVYCLTQFKKYTKDDIAKFERMLHKIYAKNDYEQVFLIEHNRQLRRQNRRDSCYQKLIQNKNIVEYEEYDTPRIRKSHSLVKFNSLGVHSQKLIKQQARKAQTFRIKKMMSSTSKLKPIQNRKLIFLNGKTHSKNQIFQSINYFKTFSQTQQKIGIKEFFKKFDKHVFLKKQLSSIFKYLDYEKKGEISLTGFFRSFYPGIKQKDLQLLLKWYSEYQQIYEADSLARNQVKVAVMSDARALPIDTLERMKQIFKAMDINNKGHLTFQDLRKAYKQGFRVEEIQNLLHQYGDGKKIKLSGLCKMLLPMGWTIEGIQLDQLQ